MKQLIVTISLFTICFSPVLSFAHDKVVVIPLNSSRAAGTDKQIQYNDGGNAAGSANMYYDKASGFVGIKTSTPSGDIQLVQSDGLSSGTGGMIFTRPGGTSDVWKIYHSGAHFSFAKEGTRLAYVEEDTGNWVQPSSRDAKNDITPLTSVLNKVILLNPVTYSYHHDEKKSKTYGFIAEDVETIFPELVSYDEQGNRGLSYSGFGPIAIGAIQEQQKLIEELRQENEMLKIKIEQIEQMLNL